MTDLDRLAAFNRAAVILRNQVGDEGVQEIGAAMTAWLEGGAADPLDKALELRTRGGVSPNRRIALADRDRMLRHLHRHHFGDLEAWPAARMMLIKFHRYESDRWPRERDALSAPSAEPATTWWRLLRAETPPPGTRQLQRILDET